MGEAAEMLLDGTMCESCGEYLGDAVGYSRSCCDEAHPNYLAEMDGDSEGEEVTLNDIEATAQYMLIEIKRLKKQETKLTEIQQNLINNAEKSLIEFCTISN